MNFFFFDLDGTLEDSRIDMANAVNMVRKSVGLEFRDVNILKKYVNKGMHELYINCFDDYLYPETNKFEALYNKIKIRYEEYYLENICIKTQCYNGIFDAIIIISKWKSICYYK